MLLSLDQGEGRVGLHGEAHSGLLGERVVRELLGFRWLQLNEGLAQLLLAIAVYQIQLVFADLKVVNCFAERIDSIEDRLNVMMQVMSMLKTVLKSQIRIRVCLSSEPTEREQVILEKGVYLAGRQTSVSELAWQKLKVQIAILVLVRIPTDMKLQFLVLDGFQVGTDQIPHSL